LAVVCRSAVSSTCRELTALNSEIIKLYNYNCDYTRDSRNCGNSAGNGQFCVVVTKHEPSEIQVEESPDVNIL